MFMDKVLRMCYECRSVDYLIFSPKRGESVCPQCYNKFEKK